MQLGVVKAKNEIGQQSRVCPDHGNPQCREDLDLRSGVPGLALLSDSLILWNLCILLRQEAKDMAIPALSG